jgi:hypothetical protein
MGVEFVCPDDVTTFCWGVLLHAIKQTVRIGRNGWTLDRHFIFVLLIRESQWSFHLSREFENLWGAHVNLRQGSCVSSMDCFN